MVKKLPANIGDVSSIPDPGKPHTMEELRLYATTTEPVLWSMGRGY